MDAVNYMDSKPQNVRVVGKLLRASRIFVSNRQAWRGC